jgi:uncharacterized iron-regulated membrane protein
VKFSPRTFRLEWDLHAWAGVIASLFLFVIFFCGVFALFREELTVWQEPALQVPPTDPPPSLDRMLAAVRQKEPLRQGQTVGFHSQDGTRFMGAYLMDEQAGTQKSLFVDGATQTTLEPHSDLAEQLYYMHFFYRVPQGIFVAGLLGIALLIITITGVVIHLKDLRRQLFQFRPQLKLRFSSSDAHKVLGVFGLPFALVMGWSGAILGLSPLLAGGVAQLVYHGDTKPVFAYGGYPEIERTESGKHVPAPSLDALLVRARSVLGDEHAELHYAGLRLLDDQNSYVHFYFHNRPLEQSVWVALDAHDGSVLGTRSTLEAPAESFSSTLFELHYGQYGGLALKLLYALLALAVCAVVITGNLIWLERRDPRRERWSNRALEKLTIGVSSGLLTATASYFVANRTLPWSMPERAELEFAIFLASWSACTGLAFVPRWSGRSFARVLCLLSGTSLLALVIAELFIMPSNLLNALGQQLPAVFVSEVCLVLVALTATGFGCALLRGGKLAAVGPEAVTEEAGTAE